MHSPLPNARKSSGLCVGPYVRPSAPPPRVHKRGSCALDSTLYSVFEKNGRQYVLVATLTPRKRCVLPLRGRGRVSGNIRIVLHPARGTASVHVPYDVRVPVEVRSGPAIGIDVVVTEVLATSAGEKLGTGYGTLLERGGIGP